MNLRPETPADYPAIADLNYRAFGNRLDEPMIVTLARHYPHFDPAFSLVAERDGHVVGHALFHPQTMRLMGENVRAVILAPLAVDPAYQKQGIGGALLEAGHKIARERGYAFSLLLGHDTYYPRFGYITHSFGVSSLEIDKSTLKSTHELISRRPLPKDVPALINLWDIEESEVDLTVRPSQSIFEWISPDKDAESLVWLRGDQIVGYSRTRKRRVSAFYALDNPAANEIASALLPGDPRVSMPLHPHSRSMQGFSGISHTETWSAAMVCPLSESPFDHYLAEIKAGSRPPGRVIWGTLFETD